MKHSLYLNVDLPFILIEERFLPVWQEKKTHDANFRRLLDITEPAGVLEFKKGRCLGFLAAENWSMTWIPQDEKGNTYFVNPIEGDVPEDEEAEFFIKRIRRLKKGWKTVSEFEIETFNLVLCPATSADPGERIPIALDQGTYSVLHSIWREKDESFEFYYLKPITIQKKKPSSSELDETDLDEKTPSEYFHELEGLLKEKDVKALVDFPIYTVSSAWSEPMIEAGLELLRNKLAETIHDKLLTALSSQQGLSPTQFSEVTEIALKSQTPDSLLKLICNPALAPKIVESLLLRALPQIDMNNSIQQIQDRVKKTPFSLDVYRAWLPIQPRERHLPDYAGRTLALQIRTWKQSDDFRFLVRAVLGLESTQFDATVRLRLFPLLSELESVLSSKLTSSFLNENFVSAEELKTSVEQLANNDEMISNKNVQQWVHRLNGTAD